jgi:Ca2+-binding EF-hand superfamily protein
MQFDKNHDGKLTRDEITDQRLLPLFDRADTNKDGIVTKEELATLYAREQPPEGRGGRGPGPQLGEIIPGFLRDRLNLTADQQQQLDALQKEVNAKLEKILTEDQRRQLKQGPPRPF